MEDAIKILTSRFKLSQNVLKKASGKTPELSSWFTELGAYIQDNDKKQEEQRDNEALLRKQRLNAEHQLSQLEKQLITCNVKVSSCEKTIRDLKNEFAQKETSCDEYETKWKEEKILSKRLQEEIDNIKQNCGSLENEKGDFSMMLEKKNNEIERLNEEWQEASKKLAEANKARYEMKYKVDEINNSEIRNEFREKRLEQEKSMIEQQLKTVENELRFKTETLNTIQKDKTASVLDLQTKHDTLQQNHAHAKSKLETFIKKCEVQEQKLEALMVKLKTQSEDHVVAENNLQQELTSQTKLVELYKGDRDHAKEKLEEVTSAISELQALVKEAGEEKTSLAAQLAAEREIKDNKIVELEEQMKSMTKELDNANDLLKVSRKSGSKVVSDEELCSLSPLAAATSAILKKGMSLTQIYTEYVKASDELLLEKEENERLKLYMEQILVEVEEKAPLLMRQKQDYEHARQTVENMAIKLEENMKECNTLQSLCSENERKVDFHKREEKRLHTLCVDLSQQVRILLKEVEEARGGVVSSSNGLPQLLNQSDDPNTSSSGHVISEHLVTFKTIEELQSQNQRLLLTVRELSEEQEKLEQDGGPEMIQELKKKIEIANTDLNSLRENHKTQDDMMQQLTRQRDMYKVLCQQGGVMVGDVSSTTMASNKSLAEAEAEVSSIKMEVEDVRTLVKKTKAESAAKERALNDSITKQGDDLAAMKLDRDRLKNKVDLTEDRYSILQTTSDGYKNEAKALEEKCRTITEALSKSRAECDQYKQNYYEAKEKLITAEVTVKSLKVEKDLIREAEKRIMQENQSLLDQQRSQNVLLNNLQTIQNNLERQEFETRKTLSKQVDSLQREVKAMRRQQDNETHQLKSSTTSLETDMKDIQIKLGMEKKKCQQYAEELKTTKQALEKLETRNQELELTSKATEERLGSVLEREASGKAKEDYQREMESYKTKVRELELSIGNVTSSKKGAEEQLEVTKKHLDQFKEICDSSEVALNTLTKLKEDQTKEFEEKLKNSQDQVDKLKKEVSSHVTDMANLKKKGDDAEKSYQFTISELQGQMAPLERRLQEVTRALVQAKESENEANKESQKQLKIAKESQEKYEKEITLHGKDVELLTKMKDELNEAKSKYGGIEDSSVEMKKTLENNEKLMNQMKEHNREEIRKGEEARQDLMNQNTILHGQVEKLSAQLATSKTQAPVNPDERVESFSDKSVEEVYELLRFVRREKEIAESKVDASETESMRYRQRSEHLQRDLDETKKALELECERTKGHMLTEDEHQGLLDQVKKVKEFEELNKNMEKEKEEAEKKHKALVDKSKKLETDMKPLVATKKQLEGEKNSWLAEKTALKQEIERWTQRTNQLMAQSTKGENEEIKKLQATKVHSEKAIAALQDDVRRTKQQLDSLKRESLKLKTENNELQSKTASLQNELKASATSKGNTEQLTNLQKENEELKKNLETNASELNDKNKIVPQLKRLAKKYKVQSDKLQKLLRENNIPFDTSNTLPPASTISVETQTTAPPPLPLTTAVAAHASATKPLTDDEKLKMNEQLEESTRNFSMVTKELDEMRAQYDTEKSRSGMLESKLDDTQKSYVECEKKVLDLKKSLETLQTECNEKEKDKEKFRKLLKTAKDKITSFAKNKDSSIREVEGLKKQIEELQTSLEQANEQINSFNTVRVQHDVKVVNLEKQVEILLTEKRSLMEKLEELQQKLDVHEQKKDKFPKSSNQQKTRIHAAVRPPGGSKSSSHGDQLQGSELLSNSPLTATVRPNAPPSSQVSSKFQQSRTASIRPLAHTAPTAMISPTVPMTQTGTTAATNVASVSALPPTMFTPQVAEVQGRSAQVGRQLGGERSALLHKARVAPAQLRSTRENREEETSDVVPSIDDDLLDQQPGPSSSSSGQHDHSQRMPFGGKRSHVDVSDDQDEDDIALLDDGQNDGKRQRIDQLGENQDEQLMTESQEGELEEDLLAEDVEEGDDDVISEVPNQQFGEDMPQQGSCVSREVQLQMERQLQPSPQELLRQSRLQGRVRTQLPSFSLISGQTNSGFYEETDDSTVPSTPTLFMPKRTDGFAEAVSSPVVRFPAFSFSTIEQPSTAAQSSALEMPGMGMHLHETRVDLMSSEDQANVPQTPLSVVPSDSDAITTSQDGMASHRADRRVTFEQQFFPAEDNGAEQNVPQQIDLTEDDDDDDDEIESRDMGDGMQDDGDEALDIMGNDNDLVDLEEEEEEEDGEGESEDDDEDDDVSESEAESALNEAGDLDDDSQDGLLQQQQQQQQQQDQQDVIEVPSCGEEDSYDEEEKEKQSSTVPEERLSPVYGGPGNLDEAVGEGSGSKEEQGEGPSTSHDDQKQEEPAEEEKEQTRTAKPVRITRNPRGVRPRMRRSTTKDK